MVVELPGSAPGGSEVRPPSLREVLNSRDIVLLNLLVRNLGRYIEDLQIVQLELKKALESDDPERFNKTVMLREKLVRDVIEGLEFWLGDLGKIRNKIIINLSKRVMEHA